MILPHYKTTNEMVMVLTNFVDSCSQEGATKLRTFSA